MPATEPATNLPPYCVGSALRLKVQAQDLGGLIANQAAAALMLQCLDSEAASGFCLQFSSRMALHCSIRAAITCGEFIMHS